MHKQRMTAVAVAMLLALTSCGTDLGPCDETMLGGSNVPGMLAPRTAQTIVSTSCAGGRCHSADAEGNARVGAPAGLDFDVLALAATPEEAAKVTRGAASVNEWADDMWAQISDGDMPPAPPAGTGALSAADKETVRNWLACGAEVVLVAPAATTADWASIWNALGPSCVSCHQPATASIAGQGFVLADMGDACTSYRNVVNRPAVTATCAGMGTMVLPGNAAGSLLVQKLRGVQTCGVAMPFGNALANTNEALVASIEQWIASGAPAPAGCTP